MTGRHRQLRPIQCLVIVLLISVVGVLACNEGDSSSGYKTLVVENRVANFSCEYRAYYNDLGGPSVVDRAGSLFTSVDILAPKKYMTEANPEPGGNDTVKMEYVPAHIEIMAVDASKDPMMPATARIENILSSEAKWPNYKLLERSAVTIAGVKAELIAYQVTGFFVGPALKYNTQLSFDRDGLQWDITAEADIDMAEVVRADFDHVIQTLKILE